MSKRAKQQETPVEAPAPDGLLDVMGAARWLSISRAKLFELMRDERDFPVIELTGKLIRFDPNALYHWALKRQRIGRVA